MMQLEGDKNRNKNRMCKRTLKFVPFDESVSYTPVWLIIQVNLR